MNSTQNPPELYGLTEAEAEAIKKRVGKNLLAQPHTIPVGEALKNLLREPMILLLLVASSLYFLAGETADGIFLAAAIILVALISLYQDTRSRNALENLKKLAQARTKVIRAGKTFEIDSEDLVPGDYLVVEEGTSVTGDAQLIRSHDFSVNESLLTGESVPVIKDRYSSDKHIYAGTTVSSGMAIAIVTHTGNATRLGKIGKSLAHIAEEKTPLELQIGNFVKKMIALGSVAFVLVWIINYLKTGEILDSLLKSLTLAMSILPEEIPVAFTTFMALGAWRLMKLGIVVRQMKTVETLGSATVLCTDKTGTLTENRMLPESVYVSALRRIATLREKPDESVVDLIRTAMWASEPLPFDPMEKALHQVYHDFSTVDERPLYQLVHEYPLGGKPPMMTHIFAQKDGTRIIAAKGAPEAIFRVCKLPAAEQAEAVAALQRFAEQGYRVLGVASGQWNDTPYPEQQDMFPFTFKGLLAFYDPPKKNIREVFQAFYEAGIEIKIITGDNAETTAAIARQAGLRQDGQTLGGETVMQLSAIELEKQVRNTTLYTRMFPEAKLKVINALKRNGEVVAMTGDGVNDGPALKAAHIGIAMGQRGTEIAKNAASLILTEDDLSRMVDAVAMGRKIYTNLKKAIRYIISIHIPIILTVLIPLALGWAYPHIFSPVHVIFLELIMGPTCSIIYENEPLEANAMQEKPRTFTRTFFQWKELATSIVQGLVITAATLSMYGYGVAQGYGEAQTRTLVFTTLISANLFLTLVNRSFYYPLWVTLRYRNRLVWYILLITIILLAALLYIPVFSRFFGLHAPDAYTLLACFATGGLSVVWYELVKAVKRFRQGNKENLYPAAHPVPGK